MEQFETIYKNEKEWLGEDNTLGLDIWRKKYADGRNYRDWLYDVSGGNMQLARLIESKKFLFGGRILANRNNVSTAKKTYSNCYVITPPEDNLESIFNTAKKLARTFSYGGGCGIDLSKVSFKGGAIHNAAKSSSGVVSFMELYDKTTEIIGQNGRRGALMMSLASNHPDIMDFINVKRDLNKINNANLSVRVDDDFMLKARDSSDDEKNYELVFNRRIYDEKSNVEVNPVDTKISAVEVLKKISEYNWENGEPGILFWDNIRRGGLLANEREFKYAGVNPCAEEPLPAGGSCLLGAINLSEFCKFSPEDGCYIFDENDFAESVVICIRALNEVLDEGIELHPLVEQQDSARRWRQIGLGVMGFADTLIKLGITYGSSESYSFIEDIGFILSYSAISTSNDIAKNDSSKRVNLDYEALTCTSYFNDLYQGFTRYYGNGADTDEFEINSKLREKWDKFAFGILKYGLANSQLLTIAPTGSISTMIGVSGGIEPLFATRYNRVTKTLNGEDTTYVVYPNIIKEMLPMWYKGEFDETCTTEILNCILPSHVVTAHDVKYYYRLKVQSIWQKYIDAAISSTINLSEDASAESIFDLYITAWELGLKGVTVFRDNCYRQAILTTNDKKEETVDIVNEKEENVDTVNVNDTSLKRGEVIPVSDNCFGLKKTLTTGCGTLHLESFYDLDTGELRECFLSKGSTGGCNSFMVAVSRLISLAARAGVPAYKIIDQLKSAGTCPSYAVRRATTNDVSIGSSCPCAVGYALEELGQLILENDICDNIDTDDEPIVENENEFEICPKCGEHAVFRTNGCITCSSCGYTKCD